MEFRVTKHIAAPPEAVWAVLADGPRYPEWDPGIARLEGRIASGESLRLFTRRNPERAFRVKVSDVVPGERMTWRGGMPLGLFRGVRTFTLAPSADGGTELTLREVFSGLLLPLIRRSMPDMTPAFEQFAAGLRARVEGSGSP